MVGSIDRILSHLYLIENDNCILTRDTENLKKDGLRFTISNQNINFYWIKLIIFSSMMLILRVIQISSDQILGIKQRTMINRFLNSQVSAGVSYIRLPLTLYL